MKSHRIHRLPGAWNGLTQSFDDQLRQQRQQSAQWATANSPEALVALEAIERELAADVQSAFARADKAVAEWNARYANDE